jgi:hypothetical protein
MGEKNQATRRLLDGRPFEYEKEANLMPSFSQATSDRQMDYDFSMTVGVF